MNRIFNVRLNLDDMAAGLDACCTDTEVALWVRGFRVGVRGAALPDGVPRAMADGHALGMESYQEASAFQEKQSEKGRASAESRKAKINHGSTTVQPRFNHGSTTVRTNPQSTIDNPKTTIDKRQSTGASAPADKSDSAEEDFLSDDPTGQPVTIIRPGGSLGDLQSIYPALLVKAEDREQASRMLALYGWDICCTVLRDLTAEAKKRPIGKQRIFVDTLATKLDQGFTLEPKDYERAGIAQPPEA